MSARFLITISVLCSVLLPFAASAQEITEKTARWYKISWNKIIIADFKVEVDGNSMASSIQSLGVVRKVSKYSNTSEGKFKKVGNSYVPTYYHSYLTQRQGSKEVTINYDASGKIIKEAVVPPDKAYKRPPVKNESKQSVVDPITAALVAREKIRASLASGEKQFSFNIYDGRRLSRLDFNIEGEESIKVLDKRRDVVRISFRRVALEGYTNNELKRMKGEEPDIVVYLGKDDLLPLSAKAAAPLGKAVFKMVKECKTLEECH